MPPYPKVRLSPSFRLFILLSVTSLQQASVLTIASIALVWVCAISSKVMFGVSTLGQLPFSSLDKAPLPFTFYNRPCPGLVLLNLLAAFATAHHPLGILPETLDTTISLLPPTLCMAPCSALSSLKGEYLHPLLI